MLDRKQVEKSAYANGWSTLYKVIWVLEQKSTILYRMIFNLQIMVLFRVKYDKVGHVSCYGYFASGRSLTYERISSGFDSALL